MSRWLFSATLLLASALICSAQDFKVKRVELSQGKVTFFYDLADSLKRAYSINVYTSRDNFIAPLQSVSGDIGIDVKAGPDRKIVWDATTELGADFDDRMAFEIRGRVYVPFVRFEKFEEYQTIKRGKTYDITWTGGSQQNILNFDLYKGDKKITTIPNVANVGRHKITLPRSVKPGKDYRFKISDSKNKDEIVYTGTFTVRRKIPLLIQAIPIIGAGVLVYFIATKEDEGNQRIPDPANPE
jgi:hypothetical protein